MKIKILFFLIFLMLFLQFVSALGQNIDITYSFLNNISMDRNIDYSNFIIRVYTTEVAICKYSTTKGVLYRDMEGSFELTSGRYHEKNFNGLSDGIYKYYIKCFYDSLNITEPAFAEVIVNIDSLISSKIVLSKEAPLKSGTLEINLVTNKLVSQTPILTYSFDGIIYNDIPLFGSEKNWKGYLIIPKSIEQTILSFRFKANDIKGRLGQEITSGNVFIIDNTKPKTVSFINAIGYEGKIRLEWYYEDEIKSFNIYRSIFPNTDFTNFLRNTEKSPFEDFSVEKGKTYYYRISAVNGAGSEGDLSREVSATALFDNSNIQIQNQGLNLELRGYVDNFLNEIDLLVNDIDQIKNTISTKEENEKNIFNSLRLDRELESSKLELSSLRKEAEKYKSQDLSKEELNKKLDSSRLKINIIKKKVPENIIVVSHESINQEIIEDDLNNIFLELYPTFSENSKKKIIDKSLEIVKSSNINIKSHFYNSEIVYLDGTRKEISVVQKSINGEINKEKNISLIEFVPKEVIQSASDINIINLNYKILKDDPILSFSSDTKDVNYFLNKKVDINNLKNTKLLIISFISDEKEGSSYNKITGYFSLISGNTSYVGIIIGLVLFLLLLFYFLFVVRKRNSDTLLEYFDKIKEALDYLEKKDLEKAEVVYNFVSKEYSNLSYKEKSKIHKEVLFLHEKILLFKLKKGLGIFEKTKNRELFKNLEKIYTNLSLESKKEYNLIFEKYKKELNI